MIAIVVAVACSLVADSVAAEDVGPESFAVVPPSASGDVPTNALILVPSRGRDVQLLDAGRAIIETNTGTETALDGEQLTRLFPLLPLRPGTEHIVVAIDGDTESELTRFTTGAGVDDDAPASPDIAVDGSRLTVTSDEPLAAVDVDAAVGPSGLSSQTSFTVFSDGVVSLVALDRAGNASEPTEVDVDVASGDAFFGCGATSSTPSAMAPFAFVALALLVRRRR